MKKKQPEFKKYHKGFILEYNPTLRGLVLKVLNPESLYPFYLEDSEAGIYKINKNKTGKVQMVK